MICSSIQTRSCYACFNFNCFRSGSPTLHSGNLWYMAASKQANIHTHARNAVLLVWGEPGCKQASKHTHTCTQCIPSSVGLTQARPNKRDVADVIKIVPIFMECLFCVGAYYLDFMVIAQAAIQDTVSSKTDINTFFVWNKTISEDTSR